MTIYANINSKNKIVGIDVSKIERDEYCSDDVQNVEVTQDIYDNANKYGINYYIYDNGDIVLNPDYQEEEKQKKIKQFNEDFFYTTLGYVKRKIEMKDGSIKDFFSDILPSISLAVTLGEKFEVVLYHMPDFDCFKSFEEYKYVEVATLEFVKECFSVLSKNLRK